jgi:hypothetical protein
MSNSNSILDSVDGTASRKFIEGLLAAKFKPPNQNEQNVELRGNVQSAKLKEFKMFEARSRLKSSEKISKVGTSSSPRFSSELEASSNTASTSTSWQKTSSFDHFLSSFSRAENSQKSQPGTVSTQAQSQPGTVNQNLAKMGLSLDSVLKALPSPTSFQGPAKPT